MTNQRTVFIGLACAAALSAGSAVAQDMRQSYEITITNLTAGQPFSPGVIVTHKPGTHVFQVGQAPSEGLIAIAEDGMPKMEADMLSGMMGDGITEVVSIDAPIMRMGAEMPNMASYTISASEGDVLSIATMLICTNDGFTGADSVALDGSMMEMDLVAYDAGSEINNELTNSIVDPCGAAGPVAFSEDGNIDDLDDDGNVVAEHAGIQGVGQLTDAHKWTGPVARLTISPKG